jgi:hypothetical protein
MNNLEGRVPASFRDPTGAVFRRQGRLYRQVHHTYQADYELLLNSGLHEGLVRDGLAIPFEVSKEPPLDPKTSYLVLEPEQLSFVSYPYEWCFGQLKDAALTTLEIQERSLQHGMSLKDASAFNIQFHQGSPLLIDSLSFEQLQEGRPWTAYRQFCRHFLAPLALMAYRDPELGMLARVHIDGVPLSLAARLLPWRTKLSFGLLTHIHLHAAAERRYAGVRTADRGRKLTLSAHLGMVDSLRRVVRRLEPSSRATRWEEYDQFHEYSQAAFESKREIVARYLERTNPKSVWDLGANIGNFSRIASDQGIFTLASDFDRGAVERNYKSMRARNERSLHPLVLDLTNPSPSLGWAHRERESLIDRGPAGLAMALALIHHLAIGNNVPLMELARFLREIGNWLIIEFIPKNDPQVQKLLANREDIFPDYTLQGFEIAFGSVFTVRDSEDLLDSERRLYLMEGR